MGLNFSHCDAGWSYGGFHRFRARITSQLGFDLEKMFGNLMTGKNPDDIENQRFKKTKDPIIPLIMHSDCDGKLTPTQCKKVAPRLLELVKSWPEDDYDRRQAMELVKGMKAAAKKNQSLEFR